MTEAHQSAGHRCWHALREHAARWAIGGVLIDIQPVPILCRCGVRPDAAFWLTNTPGVPASSGDL
jgi:hypothetical protein